MANWSLNFCFFRYTASQGAQGPVFGANDFWTGMGVLLDSFDNDGQKNNPFVSVMLNDGTRSYDHQTDGAAQVNKNRNIAIIACYLIFINLWQKLFTNFSHLCCSILKKYSRWSAVVRKTSATSHFQFIFELSTSTTCWQFWWVTEWPRNRVTSCACERRTFSFLRTAF